MKINKNSTSFIAGIFGGAVLIALLVLFLLFFFNIEVSRVLILNPSRIDQIKNNTSCIATIHQLQRDGILLTPQEYTSNIAGYYNTAIAVLVFLFILFSVVSYTHLKNLSNEQAKEHINETLKALLEDSRSFKEMIVESIKGFMDDEYVTTDAFEKLLLELEDKEPPKNCDENEVGDMKVDIQSKK